MSHFIKEIKQSGEIIGLDSCSYIDWEEFAQIYVLRFCACGVPDENIRYVLRGLTNLDPPTRKWDHPDWFFYYWADSMGFTEHDPSIRFSRLTEKGEEAIEILRMAVAEMDDVSNQPQ